MANAPDLTLFHSTNLENRVSEKIIKVVQMTYTNITIGAAGEVAITKPSAQSGYTLIGGIPFTYNGTTNGGISYMNGYLQGPPNKIINSITIYHIFVKTDKLTIVTQ